MFFDLQEYSEVFSLVLSSFERFQKVLKHSMKFYCAVRCCEAFQDVLIGSELF